LSIHPSIHLSQGFGNDINGFMHKPFSVTDLEEKVNEWAGREVDDATAMPMSMPMTGQGQLSNAAVASLTHSASADDLNVC
jgi:hypothetical protein